MLSGKSSTRFVNDSPNHWLSNESLNMEKEAFAYDLMLRTKLRAAGLERGISSFKQLFKGSRELFTYVFIYLWVCLAFV